MKKLIFTPLLLLLVLFTASAQHEFITEWQVEDNSLLFPGIGNNYTIIWHEVDNLSNTDTIINAQSGQQIVLPSNGNYIVKASAGSGTFTGFKYGQFYQYPTKILFVRQWGNVRWTDLIEAFTGCNDMDVTATDAPDLSGITSLYGMFWSCSSLTGNASFNNWNTATITNMENMFNGASIFNQPINNWNTTNVTDMSSMFYNASAFNQQLNSWNTGNVTNFSFMFLNASEFNQPLSNWNTANVTNMKFMFSGAAAFNEDINNWNTANVTSMENMFVSASNFNQPIGNWNTGKVTNMMNMFSNATAFNQPIGNWNTSNVTNMTNMFGSATAFNQDISLWNTGNVTTMFSMFSSGNFNQNINTWNTSNVTDMSHMFRNNTVFNQALDNWNTAKVINMSHMFNGATSFNGAIGNWNTRNVRDMSYMFNNATAFNQDISKWHTSGTILREMSYMFNNATSFNQPIGNWNVRLVWNMQGVLNNATSFNQSLASWYLESLNFNSQVGLSNSGIDCINYSNILNTWGNAIGPRHKLILQAHGLIYNSTGEAGRNKLISEKRWAINGDVYEANCGTAVPVMLLSFDVIRYDNTINILWSTAVEANNKGFYIERSTNGKDFEALQFVPAKGSNSNYTFTDRSPIEGKNYYRLKQTDLNGTFVYHEIKYIDFKNNEKELTLYPNPVSGGILNIRHAENATILIVNSAGQTVKRIAAKGTLTRIDVSPLAKGLYFAIVNGKGEKFVIR